MTPSGTRTRSMVMPFGRFQDSVMVPTGILECAYGLDRRGDGLDAAGIEGEAVEKSGRHAGGLRLGGILGIGGENPRCLRAHGCRHELQRLVLLRRRGQRQDAGSGARGAADFRPWRRLYRPCLQCF